MPSFVINGQPGAYIQPKEYGRTESGRYCIYTWEGTLLAIQALVNWVEGAGGTWTIQERPSGRTATLKARFPIDLNIKEKAEESWDYTVTEVEKDLLLADIPIIGSLTPDEKRLIRRILDSNPDFSTMSPPFVPGSNAEAVYQLMLAGQTSIRVNAPHLRHKLTVSNLWTTAASSLDVGLIISTPTLINIEGVPASILINLPNDISNQPGLYYGWYKKSPSVRTIALQRTQIEQEWEYGLWPALTYNVPL